MGVNYKLGADVGSFKQGMQEAQASLRTLDAQLKNNEASLKAGGNAQIYMEQKTRLLNDKMQQQKRMADQLQEALRKMAESGVSKTSVEYQRMYQQLLQAQTGMNETSYALNHLTEAEQEAAGGADALTKSVNSIGKKISLDQVISGIGSITGALEAAAQKAVQLGAAIWDNIVDTARLSDDYGTMAARYGIDVETLQKQIKVFDTMAETSIEAYQKARMKVASAISSPTDEQLNIFTMLGMTETTTGKFGESDVRILVANSEDALWEVGKRLRQKAESGELSRDNADLFAQAIFGRSFQELNPLFDMGKEAFEAQVDAQSAATKEAIENNAALADSVALLKSNFETFQIEVLGNISPSLTNITDSISDLVNSFTKYAQSEDGQKLLKSLGESVETLFEDLTKIDPESVVENFTSVFNGLKESFVWITEHKQGVIDAMKAIVAGWAGLRLAGGALQIWQLISGLRGFAGGGGTAGTNLAAVGSAAGLAKKAGGGLDFANKLLTGGAGAAAGAVTIATNGAAFGDYLLNNTRVGQGIRDTGDVFGSITSAWEEKKNEILNNASTFAQDWANLFQEVEGTLQEAFSGTEGGGGSHGFGIPVEPELADDAESKLQEEASKITVQIGARIVPVTFTGGAGGSGKFTDVRFHANGVWSVPFDGYPAILHRGERVVPAREVSSQSYNSNLYVEKMYMNNGTDAEGLASAMAAAQRRRMNGYGS